MGCACSKSVSTVRPHETVTAKDPDEVPQVIIITKEQNSTTLFPGSSRRENESLQEYEHAPASIFDDSTKDSTLTHSYGNENAGIFASRDEVGNATLSFGGFIREYFDVNYNEDLHNTNDEAPSISIQDFMDEISNNAAAHILFVQRKNEQRKEDQGSRVELCPAVNNESLLHKLAQRRELGRTTPGPATFHATRQHETMTVNMKMEKPVVRQRTETIAETSEAAEESEIEDDGGRFDISTVASQFLFGHDTPPFESPSETTMDKHLVLMKKEMPLPAVPEISKETIYREENNIELFKDLEELVVNLEDVSSQDPSFALLMKQLLVHQLSDLEKVRILFHWVTKQDLNALTFPDDLEEDTPMGFLRGIKNEKKSYPDLFYRLCSAAGLHSKVIRGHVKGVGYLPDTKFPNDEFRGAWNAVYIDGQWQLIDTNWGARYILASEDLKNKTDEERTVYRYDEHYFLTNPLQLIVTHFPDDSNWQLLRRPITMDHFQDSVKLWALHHKMGLTLFSPQSGVTVTSTDGIAEFRFRTTKFSRRDGELNCKFTTKSKGRNVGNTLLELNSLHFRENDFEVFRVFCPSAGEYLLSIYGRSKLFSEGEVFSNIAIFQIDCPSLTRPEMKVANPLNVKPTELVGPFPEARTRWGFSSEQNDLKLRPVTHRGPIITCDEIGEATLVLEIVSDADAEFLHKMYDADGRLNDDKEPLPNRSVHFTTASKNGKKFVVVKMRSPKRGIYSVLLWGKAANQEIYNLICNYLVVSHAQSNESPPFPLVPNGRLGSDTAKCTELDISPIISPPYVIDALKEMESNFPIAWINGDKEGYVTFNHAKPLVILAGLKDTEDRDLTGNVLVQDTGKHALVAVRPPKKRADLPEVKLTVFIAPADETSIPPVLNALVTCGTDEAKWLPRSAIGRYGVNKTAISGLSLCSVSNTTPLFDITASNDKADPSPCRNFAGGDFIDVTFTYERLYKLRPLLFAIDEAGRNEQLSDDTAFLVKKTNHECVIRLCISEVGFYNFTLYGSCEAESNDLRPLYYMVIHAEKATTGPPLPDCFSIWNASVCQLISPLNKNLKRNLKQKIHLKLARYDKDEMEAFPKVLLFTDDRQAVEPSSEDASKFDYEWEYVPGEDEKELHVVVQKDLETTSVSYVLQFDIVD